MGYLQFNDSTTYNYQESKQFQRKIKKLAVRQFLKLYSKFHNNITENEKYPKWGFELEIHTLEKQDLDGKVNYVEKNDIEAFKKNEKVDFAIMDEFGNWMVEMVPYKPLENFTHGKQLLTMFIQYLRALYSNCRLGTEFLSSSFLPKHGTEFMLRDQGLGDMTGDEIRELNILTRSRYMNDCKINGHPRFQTFAMNFRERRGENQNILAPIFEDENTDMAKVTDFEPIAGHIHNDCSQFGLGLCCLQATFAAKDMTEARWVNDQMHMFTPIFVRFLKLEIN